MFTHSDYRASDESGIVISSSLPRPAASGSFACLLPSVEVGAVSQACLSGIEPLHSPHYPSKPLWASMPQSPVDRAHLGDGHVARGAVRSDRWLRFQLLVMHARAFVAARLATARLKALLQVLLQEEYQSGLGPPKGLGPMTLFFFSRQRLLVVGPCHS